MCECGGAAGVDERQRVLFPQWAGHDGGRGLWTLVLAALFLCLP